MRLARPRRPQEQRRITVGDPPARRQLADLAGIERGLRIELEAVDLAHERELGELACHGDTPLVAPSDLARDEERQRFA